MLLTVWATFNNWFTVRKLERGEDFPFRALSLGNVVAMLLAMLGLVMAFYLIFGIESRT